MYGSIKKKKSSVKSHVFVKNFHHAIKSPISYKKITEIVNYVLNEEGCYSFILNINLIGNGEIKEINRQFLNHNYYTDIITFPYTQKNSVLEGELFVSLDEVKSNSLIYKDSFTNELIRVIIHGCLHLAGYNDRTKTQKELIRNKENFYMSSMKRGKKANVV